MLETAGAGEDPDPGTGKTMEEGGMGAEESAEDLGADQHLGVEVEDLLKGEEVGLGLTLEEGIEGIGQLRRERDQIAPIEEGMDILMEVGERREGAEIDLQFLELMMMISERLVMD